MTAAMQVEPRGQVKRAFMSEAQVQWLVQTVNANTNPETGNVIKGSWPGIHADFCSRFGVDQSLMSLQVAYSRAVGRDDKAQDRAANAKVKVGLWEQA